MVSVRQTGTQRFAHLVSLKGNEPQEGVLDTFDASRSRSVVFRHGAKRRIIRFWLAYAACTPCGRKTMLSSSVTSPRAIVSGIDIVRFGFGRNGRAHLGLPPWKREAALMARGRFGG
jgi:hypothetical protein